VLQHTIRGTTPPHMELNSITAAGRLAPLYSARSA